MGNKPTKILISNYQVFGWLLVIYAFILGSALLSGYYSTFNINIFSYLGLWEIIYRTLYMLIIFGLLNLILLILILPLTLISRNTFKYTFLSLVIILIIILPFGVFGFGSKFAKNIYDNKSYLYSTIVVEGKIQTLKFIGYMNGQNFFTDLSNENIIIVPSTNIVLFHKTDSDKLKEMKPNHLFNI